MNYKLVIFDFDGTLSDTIPHISKCTDKCATKFCQRMITKQEKDSFNGGVLADVLASLGIPKEQWLDVKNYYNKVFMEDISDIVLYDGVLDTLKKFKQNDIKLAVASNRGHYLLNTLLKHLQIQGFFDIVLSEGDVVKKKPDPEIVDKILEYTGISRQDTLVVGDTKYDLQLGLNAGVKTCIVDFGGPKLDIEAKPDYLVSHFDEIGDIVLSTNEK